jgi:hypothetical protein
LLYEFWTEGRRLRDGNVGGREDVYCEYTSGSARSPRDDWADAYPNDLSMASCLVG